jgi:alpha-mannosidase
MTDLTTGRKLLSGETKTVLINETDSDTWSHGITEFKNVTDVFLEGSCMLMESGPVRATIQTTTRGCNTVVTRRYQITAGSNRVTVRTKVDFREHHRMLKFRFPVNAENPSVKCEIPFGSIARPTDGTESVCQSWFAMTDAEGAGLAVLNDSKYSFDADGSSLGLTVLRGAIYADHYGQNHRDIWCEYMDQGIHEFTYALTPFTSVTDAIHQAAEINTLPFSVIETFHRGALPTQFSGVSVKDANVIVTAVKKHEDSDATVLRAYECEGKDTETEITLFGTTFKASFGHNAVKTFIVDKNGARECNFLED